MKREIVKIDKVKILIEYDPTKVPTIKRTVIG